MLDRHNIFGIPDFPVMNLLEVFLELIELGSELLSLLLNGMNFLLAFA